MDFNFAIPKTAFINHKIIKSTTMDKTFISGFRVIFIISLDSDAFVNLTI